MFPGCWFFALIISRRVVFMGVVIVNTKKWRQTVCGCVFWRDSGVWGETMSCQCSFHLHAKSKKRTVARPKKDLRNIWGDLGYFVEALGNKSVNWPLPALAPPSQCVVAACLRHGPHLPETDCHFLAFFFFVVFSPCSGLGRRLYPTRAAARRGIIAGASAKRLQVSPRDTQRVVRLFLFGPSHIREAWIKYQISRVGVLDEMDWERVRERVRESEGDRGVLVLSQWFSVTSLSLVLPSSASLLSVFLVWNRAGNQS